MAVQENQFARITEAEVERLRQFIGVEIPIQDAFNRYATPDTIRHFAHGIGDINPLFTDEAYGQGTRWGSVIAPPTFLLTCFGRGLPRGLAGVHGMWSGAAFEMAEPIRAGTRIDATGMLSALTPKQGSFAGRAILQEHTYLFRSPAGDLLGKAREWNMRTDRDQARQRGKYRHLERARYTEAEIERIARDYDLEEIRGAAPRYWEDVVIGQELPHVVKGPLRVTDLVAWKIGWGFRPFAYAHKVAMEFRKRHPAAFIANDDGVPDVPERVHWDPDLALRVGVPAPYDYGPQRVSWLAQTATNWVGDDGFVRSYRAEVRRFNLIGDTHWLKGRVSVKRTEGDDHLVDLELWGHDQRNEVTIRGGATVVLPTRG